MCLGFNLKWDEKKTNEKLDLIYDGWGYVGPSKILGAKTLPQCNKEHY